MFTQHATNWFVVRQVWTSVVKRATLFNSFCNNLSKQVARFCCPLCRSFRFRYVMLRSYVLCDFVLFPNWCFIFLCAAKYDGWRWWWNVPINHSYGKEAPRLPNNFLAVSTTPPDRSFGHKWNASFVTVFNFFVPVTLCNKTQLKAIYFLLDL